MAKDNGRTMWATAEVHRELLHTTAGGLPWRSLGLEWWGQAISKGKKAIESQNRNQQWQLLFLKI